LRFPLGFMVAQQRHRHKMKKAGYQRYPTVLMLEPLYTCNLACLGCSVERHTGKLRDRVSPEQCLTAVDECDAPIVNICGGEPTLYPELDELIAGLHERGKHVILCTNALTLDESVYGKIPPNEKLFLMIHLDGMEETHDRVCARKGVFQKAIAMIKEGKRLGYRIYLNTTVYQQTEIEEVEELCKFSEQLKVDGLLVSPGYEFQSITENIFLNHKQAHTKFNDVLKLSKKYRIHSTPAFLEFAAGHRDLDCAPWSTVNYTPKGWKAPCYLIEGEGYFQTWDEFWNKTDWSYWEKRQDERCKQCKMHSGFEHNAVIDSMKTIKGTLTLAAWALK